MWGLLLCWALEDRLGEFERLLLQRKGVVHQTSVGVLNLLEDLLVHHLDLSHPGARCGKPIPSVKDLSDRIGAMQVQSGVGCGE